MQTVNLAVTGMTCGNCVKHVEGAIKKVVQAQQVSLDLATGSVVITGEFPQGVAPVIAALQEEGYPATVTSAVATAPVGKGACRSGGSCCCH